MLNGDKDVEVSDTTGGDSSNSAGYKNHLTKNT
jgi:hypothetical protein